MTFAKKAAVALATASLAIAPVAASAAPARADAVTTENSELKGGNGGGTILLIAVLAGMVYAAYELISGDDLPTSP